MDSPIRLLIAGGSPLLHIGFVAAFQQEPRLHLAGMALTMGDAAARLLQQPCDVLAVYSDSPRADAAKAMELAADQPSELRVLLLTNSDSREELLGALRASVHGYGILRDLMPDDLCAGVLALARHGEWLCPLTTHFVRSLALEPHASAPLPSGPVLLTTKPELSDREREVLELFAVGASEQEIAKQLSLSSNTVKTYLTRIREKFDVSTRSDAVRYAIQAKIIPDRRANSANGTVRPRRPTPGDGFGNGLEDRRAPR